MTKEFINITAEANPGHASPSPGIIATVFVAVCGESRSCDDACQRHAWYHGVNAASFIIAFFGGLAASFFVALSALVQWTLTQPGITGDVEVTLALHYLLFATGGPGFSVPLGLFLLAISISAGAMRLLPRWLIVFDVIIGIIGELSVLSLIIPGALYLIPLTRFPGFVWMIAAGFKLPRRRSPAA